MIRRFYIHNFRCLENFELPISGKPTTLLIGKNGSGKSTVSYALEILQKIARGTNQVSELAKPKDFSRGRADSPMRFELEVEIDGRIYKYALAFECPKGWRELRVLEESLYADHELVYKRNAAQVSLAGKQPGSQVNFSIDWHLVALPIVQRSDDTLIESFKQWLAKILILAPIPSLITGDSQSETLNPGRHVTDFAAWFSGLLAYAPSAYSTIDGYLKPFLPDLKDMKNPIVGTDARSLTVQFATDQGSLVLPFRELSDGEKVFMISALVLAANEAYGPLLCFWDEPDTHLALSEVSHFVMGLRKAFKSGGQLIATSHNAETIASFTNETTLLLLRKSHLEPTTVRILSDIQFNGELISALVSGDLDI